MFGRPECCLKVVVGGEAEPWLRYVTVYPPTHTHNPDDPTCDVLKVDGWRVLILHSAPMIEEAGGGFPRWSHSALSSLHSPLDEGQVGAFRVMIQQRQVADS